MTISKQDMRNQLDQHMKIMYEMTHEIIQDGSKEQIGKAFDQVLIAYANSEWRSAELAKELQAFKYTEMALAAVFGYGLCLVMGALGFPL